MSTILDFTIDELISHFGSFEILNAMKLDPDLCFTSFGDLEKWVRENSELIDIKMEPFFRYANDENVYNRVVELLKKDKLSFSEWDNFLIQYE